MSQPADTFGGERAAVQCGDARLVNRGEECLYKTHKKEHAPLSSAYAKQANAQQRTCRQIELISTIDQKKFVVFPSVL